MGVTSMLGRQQRVLSLFRAGQGLGPYTSLLTYSIQGAPQHIAVFLIESITFRFFGDSALCFCSVLDNHAAAHR